MLADEQWGSSKSTLALTVPKLFLFVQLPMRQGGLRYDYTAAFHNELCCTCREPGAGRAQQMLAFARILMSHPRLLCMDEPTMGFAPIFVERVLETIVDLQKLGMAIFMVEQNAELALSIASRGYVFLR